LECPTPNPGRSLTHWSKDISEFAAARELEDFGIVAFSQGAPFALACATAEVGRALAIVSGQDDLACPELANQLNPDVANLLAAIKSDATAPSISGTAATPASVLILAHARRATTHRAPCRQEKNRL
jgi:pimeloyl-ACP methyl ester carboxylesterase